MQLLQEFGNAVPLSGTSLPSICCYTFLNASNRFRINFFLLIICLSDFFLIFSV